MSQITYTPKNIFNGINSEGTYLAKMTPGMGVLGRRRGGRPLKIWRKQGYSNTLGTSKSSKDYDCSGCSSNFIIGTEFKMLGKYISPSSISATAKRDDTGCISVDNTRGPVGTKGTGNIISFSGGSRIKSATTVVPRTYYANASSYLQSRNKDYKNNTFISRLPGINYYHEGAYISPTDADKNTSMYQGRKCHDSGTYNTVIYKPNNTQYGVQGAVDSSSRLTRLKYNTIQKSGKYAGDKSHTVAQCYRRNGIKSKCS
jgi:hypothetical protein